MAAIVSHDPSSELIAVTAFSLPDLRRRWKAVVSREAPPSLHRAFLARALAYEIQVRALGGLSSSTMRRLRELAQAAREDRFDEALSAPSIKPGVLLVRVWQGTTHRVMVARDGFVWNGERYGSLSAIAKTITGTSWNGWSFFGVKRPTRRNKNAARVKRCGFDPVESPAAASSGETTGAVAARGAVTAYPNVQPAPRKGCEPPQPYPPNKPGRVGAVSSPKASPFRAASPGSAIEASTDA